ncbi:MAG TPA: TonB-dependent receptor [Flavisolibacter sp.]|jgi:outer membrane receptor protein involved in Fe transport|nr:TonB-dependent receptor [Flavisolibacter sp.]
MRHIFTLVAIVLTSFVATAQTKISGIVNDAQGKALASSSVSLLKAKDSSLVKVAIADKLGQYEFVNVKDGNYLLAVSFTGYTKKLSQVFETKGSDISVPPFALQQASKDMNAVMVTAKKPFVETKLDKTIVNVDASPTSAGSTAMDMLEKSPGISVDNDGNISLRGKQGVIIMVDGKPTYLSATDLANMLKNMPASALDQIEIMTNPSSKYDASGNSGIINIKTKKGKNNGFNGNIMIGATSSIYRLDDKTYFMPKSQNSFNFNYRKNKLNFFGNYNPNFFRGRNTLDFTSRQIDPTDGLTKGYTDQTTRFKFGNFNQTLKIGVDWYKDKKNILGVVASGFVFNGHPTPTTIANDRDENMQLRSKLITNAKNDIDFKNFTGNVNWKHTFDSTGKELTADFDYVRYSTVSDQNLSTDIYNGSLALVGNTGLRGYIPANINIFSIKSDFTRPFKNGRFEAGIKASTVRNDNLVGYENKVGNDWVQDEIRSNHFIYEEQINAVYVSINKQIKKWTVQGGLRMENTIADGNQVTSKTTFKRDTTNFFPTAFVSYAVNQKNTLTLSFGRRIQRPNYQDLNPFIFFLDTLSFRQGNPNLRPQYTNNVELSHAFMGKFITTLSYNNTDDVISQIIKPKEGTNGKVRYLTPDNVAKFKNMALSITAPIPVAKWWNINLFTTIFNNHYKGVYNNVDIDVKYTSFMANMTNSFTITKGFTAELSGFYRHKSIEQLSKVQPLYQMSIGLQKQVMEGKGTVRLNIRDPFAWQNFEGYNQYGYIDMHFKNHPDTRQVTATFSWRFGKQLQQPQRRRNGSSQEEQSRVGGAG